MEQNKLLTAPDTRHSPEALKLTLLEHERQRVFTTELSKTLPPPGGGQCVQPDRGAGPATAAPQALTSSHPSALASAPSLLLARVFCNSLSRVFLEHTFQRSSGTGLTLPLSATPSPQQDLPAPPRSQRWDGGRGPSSALTHSKISDLRVRTRSKELHRKQNTALKIARRRIRAFIQPRLQVLHGLFCILCKNNRHQQRDEQTKPS